MPPSQAFCFLFSTFPRWTLALALPPPCHGELCSLKPGAINKAVVPLAASFSEKVSEEHPEEVAEAQFGEKKNVDNSVLLLATCLGVGQAI